uniref:UPF0415 protein C7orf25 homolog n=1 Tax=Phallusia mammillata TaxID=59560 RepID=A0A6F9D7I7_9ASCI|nr:UPF0415 protein C7orf25 homolog [Phallusia mammillata]
MMDNEYRDATVVLLKDAEELEETVNQTASQCPGGAKLVNRIVAEKKFLQGLLTGTTVLKKSHVTSSNLKNLKAMVKCVSEVGVKNITALFQRFHFLEASTADADLLVRPPICVDIVANDGKLWIKVIARNVNSMVAALKGHGQYGDKSLVDVARHFKAVAKENLIDFQIPLILFKFAHGVPPVLATELQEMEILVDGELISTAKLELEPCISTCSVKTIIARNSQKKDSFDNGIVGDQETKLCKKANLDITAMICLVSNLTNGQTDFTFGQPVLDQQAVEERSNPALPVLKDFLKDKKLIACQTAVRNFTKIVETIGGENEKLRSKELLKQVTIVPDRPSQRTLNLTTSSKINSRAKILFGTGDSEMAVTVTANSAFVRAAKQSGVIYSVFHHEARALTETKEKSKS